MLKLTGWTPAPAMAREGGVQIVQPESRSIRMVKQKPPMLLFWVR